MANKIGIEPHRLQAAIWVAKLREYGQSVESFNVAMNKIIDEMELIGNELNEFRNNLKKAVSIISRHVLNKFGEK